MKKENPVAPSTCIDDAARAALDEAHAAFRDTKLMLEAGNWEFLFPPAESLSGSIGRFPHSLCLHLKR